LQAEVINDSEIKLTWTQEVEQISGFRIERKTGSGSFSQIVEVEKVVREYTDTGITVGTDYTYRVNAFTDENESGYATSNTTNTSFPSPTNLTATPLNDTDIQLSWNDNCGFESGYRLERSDGGSFTQIAELEANVTEYTDTGLNYGTDYTYRVKAFTDLNESGYATSNTTTMSIPPPSNLVATPLNDSEIQLTWSDNCSFETGSAIERSSDGSFTQIAEVDADVTEYTDAGLTLGTGYTYRVKAFVDANESNYAEVTVNFWYDCNQEWGGNAVEDCAGNCGGNCETTTENSGSVVCGGDIINSNGCVFTLTDGSNSIEFEYTWWEHSSWAGIEINITNTCTQTIYSIEGLGFKGHCITGDTETDHVDITGLTISPGSIYNYQSDNYELYMDFDNSISKLEYLGSGSITGY
jgi:hypothetical protein